MQSRYPFHSVMEGALFKIDTNDISFTQVQAGIWTYLEVSIGITCGNLPLLRPLFRRFLEVATSNRSGDAQLNSSKINSQYHRSRLMAGSQLRSDRFTRMSVKMGTDAESTAASGSDLELQERRHIDEGITVHTDIEMSIEEVGRDSPA